MNVDMKSAIEALAEKAKESSKSEEALRFSQASLNLAHTKSMLANIEKDQNLIGRAAMLEDAVRNLLEQINDLDGTAQLDTSKCYELLRQ